MITDGGKILNLLQVKPLPPNAGQILLRHYKNQLN
jgi:hypothetical protein